MNAFAACDGRRRFAMSRSGRGMGKKYGVVHVGTGFIGSIALGHVRRSPLGVGRPAGRRSRRRDVSIAKRDYSFRRRRDSRRHDRPCADAIRRYRQRRSAFTHFVDPVKPDVTVADWQPVVAAQAFPEPACRRAEQPLKRIVPGPCAGPGTLHGGANSLAPPTRWARCRSSARCRGLSALSW